MTSLDAAPGSSSAAPRREVWFLTGSQGLYGEDTLRQVAEQSRAIAEQLSAALGEGADGSSSPVELVWKPVLTDPSAIRRVCLDANGDDDCVGLIAWMHTFSPAKMWISGLDALRKPLLHLHTQANVALPWATIDMDFMNLNQAAHGDREFGYVQTRLGVPRKTVAGHVSDPSVAERIGGWIRAALGFAEVRSLKLARFGDNMRDVAVTEGDKVEAQLRFGVSVNTYGVNDLVAVVDSIADSRVDDLVKQYEDEYRVAAELRNGGERHDSLRYAARIELGLRDFLTAGGFRAFTTNFEDLGGLRQLPGLAVQRLMADGYGFGGEGDWKTSVLLRTLKAMAAGLPGGTSFMEDYTYNFEPGREVILGAHMLEVCPSIATDTPSCEIHPLGIGGREDPVRLVFDAQPGPAVVVGLADMGERFRLVANEIDVVPPLEALPNLPVARAVWQPRPNLRTSAEAWLTAGAPHHTVLSAALGAEQLHDLAEMLSVELLVIDADTTLRQFTRELRWNQAYYRLAQGF
jgi:L-arabinose isomerase